MSVLRLRNDLYVQVVVMEERIVEMMEKVAIRILTLTLVKILIIHNKVDHSCSIL